MLTKNICYYLNRDWLLSHQVPLYSCLCLKMQSISISMFLSETLFSLFTKSSIRQQASNFVCRSCRLEVTTDSREGRKSQPDLPILRRPPIGSWWQPWWPRRCNRWRNSADFRGCRTGCSLGSVVCLAEIEEDSTTWTAMASSSWRCCWRRSWSKTAPPQPWSQKRQSRWWGRRCCQRRRRHRRCCCWWKLREDFGWECWARPGDCCCRWCSAARPIAGWCCRSCRCWKVPPVRSRIGSLRPRSAARSCWLRCGRWWLAKILKYVLGLESFISTEYLRLI